VGGVESCWRPYSAGVLHSVSDQIEDEATGFYLKAMTCFSRPITYKIARPPQGVTKRCRLSLRHRNTSPNPYLTYGPPQTKTAKTGASNR
jgi:hypothetical protein